MWIQECHDAIQGWIVGLTEGTVSVRFARYQGASYELPEAAPELKYSQKLKNFPDGL